MGKMIPVFEPVMTGNEEKYVLECLKSNWISAFGKYNEKLEEGFARYCDVKHGIGVTSGTAALHVAVAALKLGKGDEVIVSNFTMIAPALAVAYQGAKPVFVDAEPKSWTMDVSKIEEKITKRTKAILPVHIYGHPCDMDPIMEIARKYNLHVIEDAAEAHGALYRGKKIGSFGDINAFSCYSNKILTTGEGGMAVTDNDELAERARDLRNFCFDKERRFIHKEIGFKYSLSNVLAAIGVAQLERIEDIIKKKREIARRYNKILGETEGITLPYESKDVRNVYWMYGILLDDKFGVSRDKLKEELYKVGVDTRFFFTGMHKQPVFKASASGSYPVSENLEKNGLYLPSAVSLTEEQVRYVCECVEKIKRKG